MSLATAFTPLTRCAASSAAHRFPYGIDRRADARALDVGNARLVLVEELLGAVRRGVGRVARVNHLAPLLILARMALRLLDQPVDVLLAETARRGDRDLLLLAGRLVFRRHVHDAVRVDVERDFDLRHAARRRWNAD